MPVKIRLQRHGKKGKPYFWIVAADARSKRDGKYLEKLGAYNPNTNPATIELDVDGAVKWLQNGAQPTDTARAILSYKGALMKNHLAGGVRKGALTEEQAESKFNAWMEEKAGLVDAKKDGLAKTQADAKAKALAAEKEVNAKREADAAQAIADAEAAEAAANAPAEEAVADETETAEAEATTEEVIAEEAPAEDAETKTEE
jgi:small subunit ribosomal protein S16